MQPVSHKHRRVVILLAALAAGTLLSVHLFTRSSAMNQPVTHQAAAMTTFLPEDIEGTPAILLTPISTAFPIEEPSRPGALLATVLLLLCTMVAMLAGGVGIAIVMVRLRNRIRG